MVFHIFCVVVRIDNRSVLSALAKNLSKPTKKTNSNKHKLVGRILPQVWKELQHVADVLPMGVETPGAAKTLMAALPLLKLEQQQLRPKKGRLSTTPSRSTVFRQLKRFFGGSFIFHLLVYWLVINVWC